MASLKRTVLYDQALAEATAHHESNKTYSGKFLRPHAPFIREIIKRADCQSVLDYGCGKGKQYEWVSHGDDASIPAGQTIEEYWGVPVTKYDPAYQPFAAQPQGTFDLVICTHVLGSIPIPDLNWVIDELLSYANQALYVAEKIGPVRKQVFSNPEMMPRGWSAKDWQNLLVQRKQLAQYGQKVTEITFASREVKAEGIIVERWLG